MKHLLVMTLTLSAHALMFGMADLSKSRLDQIYDAICYGNAFKVRACLDQAQKDGEKIDLDVLMLNRSSHSPLSYAAYWTRFEIAKMLIEAGADVHFNNEIALNAALDHCNDYNIIQLLLENGAYSDRSDKWCNDAKIANLLLSYGIPVYVHGSNAEYHRIILKYGLIKPDAYDFKNFLKIFNEDSLCRFVLEDQHSEVQHYLTRGTLSDEELKNRSEALIYAASYLRYHTVRLLISTGADPQEACTVMKGILLRRNLTSTERQNYETMQRTILVATHQKIAAPLARTTGSSVLQALEQRTRSGNALLTPEFMQAAWLEVGALVLTAAAHGDERTVKDALQLGVLSEFQDSKQGTVLLQAAESSHTGVVKALFESTPVNKRSLLLKQKNELGETALTIACRKGTRELIKVLLDYGALDINLCSFMAACENKNEAAIEEMLNHLSFKSQIYTTQMPRNNKGQTPVMLMAQHGLLTMLRKFLDERAQFPGLRLTSAADWITDYDKTGLTTFLYAAAHGQEAVLRYMQEKARREERYHFALHTQIDRREAIAAEKNIPEELVRAAQDTKNTALHLAVQSGNKGCVTFLLATDTLLQATNALGRTALMEAATLGNYEIMQVLLEKDALLPGSSVNDRDIISDSALSLACAAESVDCVKLLLDYGAETDMFDSQGFSPIMQAAYLGNVPLLEALIAHRTNTSRYKELINKTNDAKNLFAQRDNELERTGRALNVVEVASEFKDTTPLILASKQGHLVVVKTLVKLGADKLATDGQGYKALDAAEIAGKHEVIEFLKGTHAKSILSRFL